MRRQPWLSISLDSSLPSYISTNIELKGYAGGRTSGKTSKKGFVQNWGKWRYHQVGVLLGIVISNWYFQHYIQGVKLPKVKPCLAIFCSQHRGQVIFDLTRFVAKENQKMRVSVFSLASPHLFHLKGHLCVQPLQRRDQLCQEEYFRDAQGLC